MSIEQAILQEWIREMLENARQHQRKRVRQPSNEYEGGAVIAYYEMLNSLRNTLEAFGLDLRAYGLDVDLEEELLSLRRVGRRKPLRDIRTVAGAWKGNEEARRELQDILEREW
ncbi:hypothetical protein [Alicyclobacillus sendaiensis]|uniref:Uncharacterized protein n=1 Tax=Alicyclobacillus sendaiensis PA2 TaxID=3029425 RepID=A0ABT6Y214_ALISE|nr:hypothetical protein [Alicyclobacillus sendaiensis]MDI9261092.1 hypothetical protein [Alicyclobacillus sendaiensis PA2]